MSKNKKIIWSIGSIVVLGALLNAIIITSAYIYSSSLFWILLITIPLLIVGIYNAQQTNQILDRFRIIGPKGVEKQIQYKRLSHSIYSNKNNETDWNVLIGNDQCSQPYTACIFNIGSMNKIHPRKSLIQATSNKNFDYSKNSSEETLRTYCLTREDLVWQIEPDFMGCRAENGNFNSKIFKQMASRPEIKMIELTLSSAIKSIRSIDSSLDIANTANIKMSENTFPGLSYTTFREAEGMIHFLNSLRELSGGKPIGIRLCINNKKEFHKICYAIRKTQLIPDFITVEGSFESPRTVHTVKGISSEMPLYEALLFVSQTLQVYALEKEIRVIASGKITSCFEILKLLVLGANAVCAEMPDYSTLKYSGNYRKTFSLHEGMNVSDFHRNLMNATVQAMKVCGFMNVSDITLSKFFGRLDVLHSMSFEKLNDPVLYPGTVKKMYDPKIKSYQLQEERKKGV